MARKGESKAPVTVRTLLGALEERGSVDVAVGAGTLDRPITSPLIQKPGLVLTGLFEFLHTDRIQVLGRSELRYFADHEAEGVAIADQLCSAEVPCILITRGLSAPEPIRDRAAERGIPVLECSGVTAQVIELISQFLHVALAPVATQHAVMLDMFGTGVLLMGESGIGKSECALELLARGHRLVADDAVDVWAIEEELVAGAPELTRNLIEIRGLGIINVRDTFGIGAVRTNKVIELVVRLEPLGRDQEWDRLGSGAGAWDCLGVTVPLLKIPVAPGRNLAVLVEMAVEQHLLREAGSDTCHDVQAAVARRIARNRGMGGA